jgi:hypothetical protein
MRAGDAFTDFGWLKNPEQVAGVAGLSGFAFSPLRGEGPARVPVLTGLPPAALTYARFSADVRMGSERMRTLLAS